MTELATPPVAQSTGVKRISHWIGGRIVAGESGRSSPVYNPATGKQTGALDLATEAEVDQAVQAAKQAFETWRAIRDAPSAPEHQEAMREQTARVLESLDLLGELTADDGFRDR